MTADGDCVQLTEFKSVSVPFHILPDYTGDKLKFSFEPVSKYVWHLF
jgi:hypothetical protein